MIELLHSLAKDKADLHITVACKKVEDARNFADKFMQQVFNTNVPVKTTPGLLQVRYGNGSKVDFRVYDDIEQTRGIMRDVLYFTPDTAPDDKIMQELVRRTSWLIIQAQNN